MTPTLPQHVFVALAGAVAVAAVALAVLALIHDFRCSPPAQGTRGNKGPARSRRPVSTPPADRASSPTSRYTADRSAPAAPFGKAAQDAAVTRTGESALPIGVLSAASAAAAEVMGMGALHVGAHVVERLIAQGYVSLVEGVCRNCDTPVFPAERQGDWVHAHGRRCFPDNKGDISWATPDHRESAVARSSAVSE